MVILFITSVFLAWFVIRFHFQACLAYLFSLAPSSSLGLHWTLKGTLCASTINIRPLFPSKMRHSLSSLGFRSNDTKTKSVNGIAFYSLDNVIFGMHVAVVSSWATIGNLWNAPREITYKISWRIRIPKPSSPHLEGFVCISHKGWMKWQNKLFNPSVL